MAKQSNVVAMKNNDAVVNVHRSIKSHNDPKKRNGMAVVKADFNVDIDFANMSPREIMDIAVDAIVVTLQSRARQKFFAKENMGKDGKTPVKSFNVIVRENIPARVNVREEIVSKARTPGKSLGVKVADMFEKLSPTEKAAQLKAWGITK